MRFWDSSALVPLLIEEAMSPQVLQAYLGEDGIYVWWASDIECASALARLERQGLLDPEQSDRLHSLLREQAANWNKVVPHEAVKEQAHRVLRRYELRAADALQLAAALVAAEENPSSLGFVTLDEKLLAAARSEGFPVANFERRGVIEK